MKGDIVRMESNSTKIAKIATRMAICEREEEIKAFVPKEYWSIELIASNKEENNC